MSESHGRFVLPPGISRLGALDIDMDPLMVAGRIGKFCR